MPSSDHASLWQARRWCAVALALLALAGFRHHLWWGQSSPFGCSLRPWLDAAETACLVGFAWFGVRGWRQAIAAVHARSPGRPALLRATLPLLLLAIVAPPFLSADVADYVMRGRVLALHGANPYLHVAGDFPNDPFLGFGDAAWKNFPLPYGPLVADLQGATAWLADRIGGSLPLRGQFVLAVVLLKTVFAAAVVAGALLARGIHARLRGGDGDVAFVAVAWCPLLLNEALASAHNEALLLLAVLAAVHAALAGRCGLAATAIGLGVLTKIVPVLLAPLLLVWALRTGRGRSFAVGVVVASAIAAIEAWRYFTEPTALGFLGRQSDVTRASIAWVLAEWGRVEVATSLLVGRAIVIALLAVAAVQLWRRPTGDRLLLGSAAVLGSAAGFALAGFGPWYHVWWAPLALLGSPGFVQRCAVAAIRWSPLGYVCWTAARRFDAPHQVVMLTFGVVLPVLAAAVTARTPRAPVVPSA